MATRTDDRLVSDELCLDDDTAVGFRMFAVGAANQLLVNFAARFGFNAQDMFKVVPKSHQFSFKLENWDTSAMMGYIKAGKVEMTVDGGLSLEGVLYVTNGRAGTPARHNAFAVRLYFGDRPNPTGRHTIYWYKLPHLHGNFLHDYYEHPLVMMPA